MELTVVYNLGQTALDDATQNKHRDLAFFLIKCGAHHSKTGNIIIFYDVCVWLLFERKDMTVFFVRLKRNTHLYAKKITKIQRVLPKLFIAFFCYHKKECLKFVKNEKTIRKFNLTRGG